MHTNLPATKIDNTMSILFHIVQKGLNLFLPAILIVIIIGMGATPSLASQIIKDDDPGSRTSTYLDDSRDGYLSGWKVIVTNANPVETLESGRWFEAPPVPRPFATGTIKRFSKDIRTRLRYNSTDSLFVVKNGAIVGQYFRYGFAIDDIHLIHSAGKCFTSFAIQPVYDRIGKKGLNRPLSEYLPQLKGKFFGMATLAQALDMKVGMEWTENYEDPTSATMVSGIVGGWDPLDPKKVPESWYERMFDYPKYGEHGKTWVYSSASVIAAAYAGAAIDGRHYSELVQESYNFLGFEDRSWYVSNAFNELSAEGGQAMTIRDFTKLGRFMLETKYSNYVNDVWKTKGNKKDPADAVFLKKYGQLLGAIGYKNYWYKISDDVIMAVGSSGQFMYVDRKKNLIISKYSSFMQGQGAEEFAAAIKVINDIAGMY